MVLDEPVASLDAYVGAQVLELLKRLHQEHRLSYLLISHDLRVIGSMCRRVAVMYLGRIVEEAPAKELFTNPLHPYTKALISAALPSHPDIQRDEIILTGEVPSPVNPPSGCHFHPRCPYVMDHCSQVDPVLQEVGSGQPEVTFKAGRKSFRARHNLTPRERKILLAGGLLSFLRETQAWGVPMKWNRQT